jgi:hypothetical protein
VSGLLPASFGPETPDAVLFGAGGRAPDAAEPSAPSSNSACLASVVP